MLRHNAETQELCAISATSITFLDAKTLEESGSVERESFKEKKVTDLNYTETGEVLLIEDVSKFDERYQLQKSSIVTVYRSRSEQGERLQSSFTIDKKAIRCAAYSSL